MKPAASGRSVTAWPTSRRVTHSCQLRKRRASAQTSAAAGATTAAGWSGPCGRGTCRRRGSSAPGCRRRSPPRPGEAVRASPVRRHGPSGRPSAVAGNTSRPDADTASASGGSWRTASWSARRRSEATVAARPRPGRPPGTRRRIVVLDRLADQGDRRAGLVVGPGLDRAGADVDPDEAQCGVPPRGDRQPVDDLVAAGEPNLGVEVEGQADVPRAEREAGADGRRRAAVPGDDRVLLVDVGDLAAVEQPREPVVTGERLAAGVKDDLGRRAADHRGQDADRVEEGELEVLEVPPPSTHRSPPGSR